MSRTAGALIVRVRRASKLSQAELARRAGTSRPTLSAYEHGRKSPSLETLERLVAAAGQELEIRRRIAFRRYVDGVLLVDLWDELVLPTYVRAAWAPLIQDARGGAAAGAAS